jgi:hypothetical protein
MLPPLRIWGNARIAGSNDLERSGSGKSVAYRTPRTTR